MKPDTADRVTRRWTKAEADAVFLLENGARMDQKTFHALYVKTPDGFKAELVGGTVYVMASPTQPRHGRPHARAVYWLGIYTEETPGTDVFDNTTNVLGAESEPEPDACLIVLPECGGRVTVDAERMSGPADLVVEVANSSRAIDLGTKKRDYERAGVREYLVILAKEESVVWFRRTADEFVGLTAGADGLFRSETFPGLWLDVRGLFTPSSRPLSAALRRGLASPEHVAFVAELAARRKAKKPKPAAGKRRNPAGSPRNPARETTDGPAPAAPPTRRDLLATCGMGMGLVGLAPLLADAGLARAADPVTPLAPKAPHFPAKAKRVIHIFANGGPSQVDTFDPKPALAKYAGKSLPAANLRTERRTGAAFPSPFRFERCGKSGVEVSELFAHTSRHIDDICVVRSMHADVPNHEPSFLLMNTGEARLIRPSVGSWVTYGLGTENQNLPGFVSMCPGGLPLQEAQNWQAGFLPGVFQGTYIDSRHTDVEKLVEHVRSKTATPADQRKQLDLLAKLNAAHQTARPNDPQLEARIRSFELAYRMQSEAAEAFDVSKEPKAVLEAYGPGEQARSLLLARRLVERGVRFVQVSHGPVQPWDSHENIAAEHRRLATQCDRGIAALLTDLKRLGLFESTLVVWGGEFGRTPVVELPSNNGIKSATGRDHNHYGFSMWLAGGGVKGGQAVGATDEFGFKAVENPVHVHDLHATMLHLLGFDHEKFTFRYAGRDFRLTDVHGRVVKEVLA